MISDNNKNTPISNNDTFKVSSGFGFNLRDQIIKYLKKWYWFVLSATIFLVLAYVKVRYTIPQYNVASTIIISQDENISESELAAFKDLGLINNTQNSISNEIQIIKSRTLITNVVNNLKLNVRYFSEGRILEVENYPKSLIEINFLSHDSIVHTKSRVFHVRINSDTSFSFLDQKGNLLSDHSFGKTVSDNSIGDIVITPNTENIAANVGNIIKIHISPVNLVTELYRNKLIVVPVKNSSTVKLSLNDPVKEKAKDIINHLVEEYNKSTIENKKQISARTAEFINERLNLISGDLSEVDDEAAGYLSKYGLTSDIGAQSQRVADIDTRNVQETAQLNTQLSLIESMRRFVLSQDGRYDLIPANLGFNDNTISATDRWFATGFNWKPE